MTQYIDKDALVAEIERKKDVEVDYDESSNNFASYADQIHYSALDSIENFINTLEVKEVDIEQLNKLLNWWKEVTTEHSVYKVKEVDLEKEFNNFLDDVEGVPRMWHSDEQIEWGKDIAKHFLGLGLNLNQKGE